MILTRDQIVLEMQAGRIKIDPFDPKRLQPNSYDVTLGRRLLYHTPPEVSRHAQMIQDDAILDVAKPVDKFFKEDSIPPQGYVLHPGILYLAGTVEAAGSDFFVPHIDGKSSLGRLGMTIHVTAGRGEIGFTADWTLEVTVISPLRIYAGMPVAQISFYNVMHPDGVPLPQYRGKYADQRSPAISQYHRNKWSTGEKKP